MAKKGSSSVVGRLAALVVAWALLLQAAIPMGATAHEDADLAMCEATAASSDKPGQSPTNDHHGKGADSCCLMGRCGTFGVAVAAEPIVVDVPTRTPCFLSRRSPGSAVVFKFHELNFAARGPPVATI